MNSSFFIDADDYFFKSSDFGGSTGEKLIACPKEGYGTKYVVKTGGLNYACNEFVALNYSREIGINVPHCKLINDSSNPVEPHAGIEFLELSIAESSYILSTISTRRQYIMAVIIHCLFDDFDSLEFYKSSDGKLYTLDFSDGMLLDSTSVILSQHFEKHHSSDADKNFLNHILFKTANEYIPNTLYAYEYLSDFPNFSNDVFQEILKECCAKFIAADKLLRRDILSALGALYPKDIVRHFDILLNSIASFCQDCLK